MVPPNEQNVIYAWLWLGFDFIITWKVFCYCFDGFLSKVINIEGD